MEYRDLKDYKPPDWGGEGRPTGPPGAAWPPDGSQANRNAWEREDGSEAGPSDYLRRAWRRRGEKCPDVDCSALDEGDIGAEKCGPSRRETRDEDTGVAASRDFSARRDRLTRRRTVSVRKRGGFRPQYSLFSPDLELDRISASCDTYLDEPGISDEDESLATPILSRPRRPISFGGGNRPHRTTFSSPSSLSALLPALFLPFLPLSAALPPFPRQTPSPPPTDQYAWTRTAGFSADLAARGSATSKPYSHRDVQFITSAEIPATLPTPVTTLDATALPYLITQGGDGLWSRAEGGWKLYGRQSSATPVPGSPDSQQAFAVEEVLPPGWGVQSTRTDFYRVPLIVIASVIIALSLVVTIIVVAFKRRKAHRRAKRRAERQRRKALAAAGLTEDGVNGANAQNAQDQMTEKLDELQRQHRAKRKGDAKTAAWLPRNKVRNWRIGLRRRRGAPGAEDEGATGVEGTRDGEGHENGQVVVVDAGTVADRANDAANGVVVVVKRGSNETDRSTPTAPSEERASGGSGSGSDGLGIDSMGRTTTESSEFTAASDRESRESPSIQRLHLSGRSGAAGGGEADVTPGVGGAPAPYFPPAYRPASVRSFSASPSDPASRSPSGGPSRPLASSDTGSRAERGQAPMHAAEKVRAPGYYAAPATADGEIALAVASRSEGKQRMVHVPLEPSGDGADGEREGSAATAHLATDDKRVLERLRMAASAPPAPPVLGEVIEGTTEHGNGASDGGESTALIAYGRGPSAPHVELDESGFEALPTSSPELTANSSRTNTLSLHPSIPAPPQRPALHRSWTGEVEREVHEQLDELNLLPSAPPAAHRSYTDSIVPVSPTSPPHVHAAEHSPSAPSAPPLLAPNDEAGDEGSSAHAPSAPPLDDDAEGQDDEQDEPALRPAPSAPVISHHHEDQASEGYTAHASTSDTGESATAPRAQLASHAASRSLSRDAVPEDDVSAGDVASRRPSQAPSEPRVFLPKYEP